MIPLLGFAPDADVTKPGVITDCVNFIPCENGMEGGPSATTPSDAPALAAECFGAAVVTDLSGTRRVLAGTATKLYELSGGSWTDQSRVAAYSASDDSRWTFAQFGNTALAANRADTIQRSTGTTFADIATAPKAEVIFTVGSQVMALNVNDGAEKPDGWHCCAINDDTDWTESLTTQSASGRLVSTPGELTAGARLGEYAVAYKTKSIYLGQYVGSPAVWDWMHVPGGEVGCVGKEALCDLGSAHFFVGDDNFWLFDGTRPTPIGDNVLRQWFYDNSNPSYRYKTKCVYDRQNDRVWVFFPGTSSTTCDQALVYHVRTQRWGRSNRSVEAVLNYVATGLTFDTFDDAGATFNDLTDVAFDSQFWLTGGQALSAINTSHQLQLLTGDSTSSSFTTGDVGDDSTDTFLKGIRLRFAPGYAPSSASAQIDGKMDAGDSYTTGPSSTLSNGKFDALQEARWHRATFSFVGPVRVTGAKATIAQAGTDEG
jgi:hypothetical protein